MGKINFEEYRQPWETGPHWELKREFMEKYQDDFPEDRLLCLAQAYSNIELLHCSYPDPVMLQIHELSKSLNGCKRFREATKNSSKDEPELQARSGKRNAYDDLKKPFKFIKFYSVGNQSSEAADSLATGENTSTDKLKSNSPTEDRVVSTVATPSIIPFDTNSTSTFILSNCSTQNEDFILSLAQSPDLNLIRTFSEARANLKNKSTTAFKEINRTIDLLNLHGIVHYKFENVTLAKHLKPFCLCKFYIKDTLISIGRDTSEKSSWLNAAAYAMDILVQFSNLPVVALSNLKSGTHKSSLLFLHMFLQEATKPHRAKLNSVDKVWSIIDSLKCPHEVAYFYREDLESPLNTRIFYADLVINKVFICTAKSTRKKNAKSAAADQIIPLLEKFFNEHPKDNDFQPLDQPSCLSTPEDDGALKIDPDDTINIFSVFLSESDKQTSGNLNINFLPQMKDENSKRPLLMDPKASLNSSPCINPDYFKINYVLLNNSMEKQFAILDSSEITPDHQTHTPQTTLTHSAQFCRKSLSFDVYESDSAPSDPKYICDIYFEGEQIGAGAGFTKPEAKTRASVVAIQTLEKQFYTIKVKSELDESFVIKRDQMMNACVASDAVSDSNVGCKMLKMMGWTGGGIGKTSGITEPIMASEHRFHQGLGFADDKGDVKKFQRNIESLLKEFSQTDTTSDLIFSSDFTKDERKIIHKVSLRFGLVGNSKGKGNTRQLFVKHKISAPELVNTLIRAGGCTHKYELVDRSTACNDNVDQA